MIRWRCFVLWICLGFGFLMGMELLDFPAVDKDHPSPFLSDPHHLREKRSIIQIPLGTSGFPIPVDIDPIPSGPRVTMPHISFRDMGTQVELATVAVNERFDTIEPAIYNNGVRQIPGTPAWFMAASHKTKVVAKNISRIALIAEEATKYMAQEFKLDKDQITYGLPTADVRGTVLGDRCPVEVDFPCQPRKYRAFNGYCNNVQNPKWGNANTRYLRFLPADYGDGVSVPRQSARGEFLPSSRVVSLSVHGDHNSTHKYMTAMAAMFGEFIFHDLSHTPQMAGYIGQRLRCCNVQFNDFHPECYPVRLPEDDPVYSKVSEKCQEYVRSGTAPRTGCTLGPREQINQVTSFLDVSTIYGSSKEESDEVRLFKDGLIKVQRGPQGTQVLDADDNQVDCNAKSSRYKCFKSGDVRVNEHIGLASMHQLFVREHNRIAEELGRLNTHWNDEQVFQETRRIVGSELQHIVYTEFLPAILGQGIVEKYGLAPQKSGFFTGYDININAGVANSVSNAALAFVLSMIPNTVEFYKEGRKLRERPITDSYYSPFDLYERGSFDEILEGLVHSHAQNEDPAIADAIGNRMFMDKNGIGIDRAATVIQQGRDHGIASYNEWRSFCGLSKAKRFDDLRDVMSSSVVKRLKAVYESVDDIDLFTGGLAEKPNRGALVGPTFGCLVGRQFHYLRRGDRYWYENDIPPSAISKDQLYEIRKVTLARIMCDNSDNIQYLQPTVMIEADPFLNAEMSCRGKNIPSVNLKKWKTASPNFVVPDEMLQESIERAKRDIGTMRDSEWNLWESRKRQQQQPTRHLGVFDPENRHSMRRHTFGNRRTDYSRPDHQQNSNQEFRPLNLNNQKFINQNNPNARQHQENLHEFRPINHANHNRGRSQHEFRPINQGNLHEFQSNKYGDQNQDQLNFKRNQHEFQPLNQGIGHQGNDEHLNPVHQKEINQQAFRSIKHVNQNDNNFDDDSVRHIQKPGNRQNFQPFNHEHRVHFGHPKRDDVAASLKEPLAFKNDTHFTMDFYMMEFVPNEMFNEPIPMTDEHMNALIDRQDFVSPRVAREAEFLLLDSFDVGMRAWNFIKTQEKDLWNTRRTADPQGASGSAYAFNRPKNQAIKISNTSFILQFASARFVNNFLQGSRKQRSVGLKDIESGSVSPNNLNDLMDVLPNIDVTDIMEIPNIFECDDQTLPCDHTSRFRTATGWCNNLNIPNYGKSFRAQARLLRPSYEDGLSKPREFSKSKKPLPSGRLVSTNIHSDVSASHVRYTMMIMQWGQLIDHDIIFTPVNKGFQDSILDCRQCDSPQKLHPECMPIHIPRNDPFFPPVNISSGQPFCMPLTRSMPGQLTLGYREQLNQVTSFVDASHTYGSDKCEQRKLRTFKNGHLKWTDNPLRGKPFLPTDQENHECKAPSGHCFTGGDTRASEQPALAALHTLFLREHNRVADELKKLNKHWSDEAVFQQSRRIVTAINQHITYNEWLPRILGWNAINLYELNLLSEGYYEDYDPYCNPTVLNEIGIVFRFGHTLLKPAFERMDGIFAKRDPPIKLSDHFFNTDLLYQPGMLDEIMRGLTTVSIETFDQFLTKEVTNHLFEEKEKKFSGLDLAALNIQRGRDHGLQTYNEYRVLCNLTRARDFDDLSREVARPIIDRLKRTYDHVDDIDLFTGGLVETPLHGGLLGPTFGCIMGIQFRNLRKCDRFWYENADPLVRFTDSQLTEVRKVTLSRLMCDNCESVDSEQRSAFDLPDPFLNPRVSCRDMPSINLDLWKERVSCGVGSTNIEIGAADRISPCVMCTCTKEGPICQSLKIDNCFHLAKSYSPEAILNDHVCKVQCAFAFRAFPKVGGTRDSNKLGFSRR